MVSALAPASLLHPSQQRALDLFLKATDGEPGTVQEIGHAALSAQTPAPATTRRNIALVLGRSRWTSDALQITCVDAYTGERCVVTREADTTMARAAAASSAVPGIFAPQPIADRRCMDGGVSGTGTHLDLLAGARRVLILALTDGSDMTEGMMTSHPVRAARSSTTWPLGHRGRAPDPRRGRPPRADGTDQRPAGAGHGRTPGLGRRRAPVHLLGLSAGDRTPTGQSSVAGGVTEAATAPTSPPTARSWATVMALTMATDDDEPWLITHTPSTPSSMAPPVLSGSSSAASGRRWGYRASAVCLTSGRRGCRRGGHQEPHRALERLEGDVAGEAVGHDHVGRPGEEVAALDVAHEVECRARRLGSRSWVSFTSGVPLDFSSPIDNSATRGWSMP